MVAVIITLILLARFITVLICSFLSNMNRHKDKISYKQSSFLWFAGVRGGMAFAISINSIKDWPLIGPTLLILTLFTTLFTLLYSSLFGNCVFNKCGIIQEKIYEDNSMTCKDDDPYLEDLKNVSWNENCFEWLKKIIYLFSINYLAKWARQYNRQRSSKLLTNFTIPLKNIQTVETDQGNARNLAIKTTTSEPETKSNSFYNKC